MNQLTDVQQKIIIDIKKEFVKINEQKSKLRSSSLIDFNKIYSERDADIEKRDNIETNNALLRKVYSDLLNSTIDSLNESVSDYGLICVKSNCTRKDYYSCYIKIANPKLAEAINYNIEIYIPMEYSTIYFKSKIDSISEIYPPSGFKFGVYKFDDIQTLCKTDTFIEKIKYLLLIIERQGNQ